MHQFFLLFIFCVRSKNESTLVDWITAVALYAAIEYLGSTVLFPLVKIIRMEFNAVISYVREYDNATVAAPLDYESKKNVWDERQRL